jgi:adenylate kinase
MEVVLEEARQSYEAEILQELPSNTIEELESNVSRIEMWADHWLSENAEDAE